ncbi:MAG: hypothetical protein ACJAQU_000118 [Loktanella salsilacus]|jgi:hypothetical protein
MQKMKFTTNPNKDNISQNAALVSGAVKQTQWRYSKTSKRPNETTRVTFATQLNLTRFIQAQRLKRRSPLNRPNLAAGYVLAINPEESWYTDEVPLIPATNVIIGPREKYAFALKKSQSAHLSRYLNLVKGMLNRVVSQSLVGEDATYERFAAYSLKEIEFYWEFDSTNPIDYVESIRPNIIATNENVGESLYEIQQTQYDLRGQSPCLTVRLTRDIKLKIYAKTNRRVRFEVTLKQDAINRAAGRRTTTSSKALIDMVPQLAEEAASRVNTLLQSIAAPPAPPSTFTSVQLIHAITRACNTPYESETIIAALTTFGRIALQNNDPMKDIIHTLKDRGILRNLKSRSKVYVATDVFKEPLERLRQFR